ncbi:MAG: outer membrane protein assembly factor BamA [Candidatus Omnitrophota bacterium]
MRIKSIALAAFLLFGLANFSFAQDEPQAAEGQTQIQQEAAAPPAQKIVTAIEVKGNKAISTNVIISKMKSRIGSPYQESIVSDDLKRLYLLGFFSDIKIDSEAYKDGLKVIVSVEERPIIEKINFTGIERITIADEKIKEKLKSREGQYLDYPNLEEDVRMFKKMYEGMGFSSAQIKYDVSMNKETGKAIVLISVAENKKVRIKDITVEGNTSYPESRILRLLKTKKAWFFNAGVLKDEVLKEDIERIKSFYRREGFTDAAVEYSVSPGAKKPYLLYIRIKILEGKKYMVGNVTIQGNIDIAQKDILGRLKECVTGKVFSEEALKADVANIQGLYFDRGYIACSIQEAASLNSYTNRVDITYSIVENAVCFVEKIKVRGNIKTKDVVIRRELRIQPGERFDGEKLKRSKERLQNLGFFEEVSYDTEDASEANKKNLLVEVKESKTGSFSFGGGYSTVEQFVGFVEVEQKNFDWRNFPYFTGAGQNLTFRASVGSVSNTFDLSFTEPWAFDYPVSFGFDGYRRDHKRSTDVGYGYDEKVTGGDLRLGKEISEYLRGDLMYRLEQIDISNIADNSPEIEKERGRNMMSSLTPSITFDSRNNVFDTKKGNLLTSSLEVAGGPFGGDKSFWKFFTRASHYFPLLRDSSLEVRLRAGLSAAYKSSDRIPIYERFFAGGASTIRGYDERKIGPMDESKEPLGGNGLAIGNIEYTYPVFNFLKVAAFLDAGNVWDKLSRFGTSSLKSSYGLGLRLNTPIGPIMLDYGIPLSKASGEDKKTSGKFHFSASHGF